MTRVLIADDNETVRSFLRFLIQSRNGLEVCAECADGQDAFEKALALKPDLAILDVVMPNLNGVEIAGALKAKLLETKIILFTMYGDYVGDRIATASGVDVVIPKEAGLAGLLRALASFLPPSQDSGFSSRPAT